MLFSQIILLYIFYQAKPSQLGKIAQKLHTLKKKKPLLKTKPQKVILKLLFCSFFQIIYDIQEKSILLLQVWPEVPSFGLLLPSIHLQLTSFLPSFSQLFLWEIPHYAEYCAISSQPCITLSNCPSMSKELGRRACSLALPSSSLTDTKTDPDFKELQSHPSAFFLPFHRKDNFTRNIPAIHCCTCWRLKTQTDAMYCQQCSYERLPWHTSASASIGSVTLTRALLYLYQLRREAAFTVRLLWKPRY